MAKKPFKSRNLSVYSNLTRKHKTRRDADSRKKAEYLATLPKDPIKRILHRMKPKNFFGYWFSKKGGIMALKIAGVGMLMMVLTVGALFAYYRKDLDSIRPGEISKRVQTTVTKYYDRNNVLLTSLRTVDGEMAFNRAHRHTLVLTQKTSHYRKRLYLQPSQISPDFTIHTTSLVMKRSFRDSIKYSIVWLR